MDKAIQVVQGKDAARRVGHGELLALMLAEFQLLRFCRAQATASKAQSPQKGNDQFIHNKVFY
jgi:hypothetical protein